MVVKVSKPEINVREKLSELDYGVIPFEKMPTGSVLQVVQNLYTSTCPTSFRSLSCCLYDSELYYYIYIYYHYVSVSFLCLLKMPLSHNQHTISRN